MPAFGQPAGDEIHRRRPDESGNEDRIRVVVHLVGRADLLDVTIPHDDDPLGQGHGLDLIVGHVDDGGLDRFVQLLDLGPHLGAQLGVQVGQRLVEQKDGGTPHDGPPHGDSLALPAGQRSRLAVEKFGNVENFGRGIDPFADFRRRHLLHFEAERQVLVDRQVRIKGVVLEHHGDVPVLRRQFVDHLVADKDLARGDFLKAGDHPQNRALAAPRWANQHDEFVVPDFKIDPVDDLKLSVSLDDLRSSTPAIRSRSPA